MSGFSFQFHKGAIETALSVLSSVSHLAFNSIKVRLKPKLCSTQLGSIDFQFHKGAIETLGAGRVLPAFIPFNSIKVRLNLVALVEQRPLSSFNSIKVRLKPVRNY